MLVVAIQRDEEPSEAVSKWRKLDWGHGGIWKAMIPDGMSPYGYGSHLELRSVGTAMKPLFKKSAEQGLTPPAAVTLVPRRPGESSGLGSWSCGAQRTRHKKRGVREARRVMSPCSFGTPSEPLSVFFFSLSLSDCDTLPSRCTLSQKKLPSKNELAELIPTFMPSNRTPVIIPFIVTPAIIKLRIFRVGLCQWDSVCAES